MKNSTIAIYPRRAKRFNCLTGRMIGGLFALAIATSGYLINSRWQLPVWALFQASANLSLNDMAIQLSLLPTMLVAILAGGILGSSSILLQQLVKNTLASDTTLAVGSGAQMALLIVTLFLPSFGLYGSFWVCRYRHCTCVIASIVIGEFASRSHLWRDFVVSQSAVAKCGGRLSNASIGTSGTQQNPIAWLGTLSGGVFG